MILIDEFFLQRRVEEYSESACCWEWMTKYKVLPSHKGVSNDTFLTVTLETMLLYALECAGLSCWLS